MYFIEFVWEMYMAQCFCRCRVHLGMALCSSSRLMSYDLPKAGASSSLSLADVAITVKLSMLTAQLCSYEVFSHFSGPEADICLALHNCFCKR